VLDAEEIVADAHRLAGLALAEDGPRDITSEVSVSPEECGVAVIEAREALVMAGGVYADAIVSGCGLAPVAWRVSDGEHAEADTVIGTISGSLAGILRAERPLLNLLQRGCGIATLTRQYVDAVAPTNCMVLHTRKTTPGLRLFEIMSVRAGRGELHRRDLSHAVMIKDNHWQALRSSGRSLAAALAEATAWGITELCVEVESLDQLNEACLAGATRLLIDNQAPATVRAWAEQARSARPGIAIEATGGITLATVQDYAMAGADYVSIGALTHSAPAADLGLELREVRSGE
jgi:nicotinate-nucleotide pyrophosphorylase (carboxylating)